MSNFLLSIFAYSVSYFGFHFVSDQKPKQQNLEVFNTMIILTRGSLRYAIRFKPCINIALLICIKTEFRFKDRNAPWTWNECWANKVILPTMKIKTIFSCSSSYYHDVQNKIKTTNIICSTFIGLKLPTSFDINSSYVSENK